ncbi:hypothetical protein Pyrfu_1706 [Pyrolobus fumarii 1A]|uniref:CDC48 N-terminal subdomain domain-containing protein n=1 Tax=Pyrolobus fumarii (strain DSM 11204 / 1A) TaxID=694429 RepID=G0ECJ2_PYRF1|nr:hypothetical protein [Pyrolobus fumarii]AEM39562.1 hypothetical protein Pyrfu_1706 [Pyrolobus fumarii 1A]
MVAEQAQPGTGEEKPKKKRDIRTLLQMIPPASQLFGEQKRVSERRIRMKFHDELKEGIAKINPQLARELGIKDKVEVVVAHRHRFVFNAVLDDEVPVNEIWVNGEKLREEGVADNSIVTVRAYRGETLGGAATSG